MARSKPHRRFRAKLIAYAVLALAAGVVLLVLSQTVKPSEPAQPAPAAPAPGGEPTAPDKEGAAAQNMSGLLLLFSMAGFLLSIFFTGWIVVDIYKARPAWKTQTKYPRRR